MAYNLPIDKKIAVISALCEGSGIRSIERVTGVHRDTIMRPGVKVGQGCAALMDRKMQNLSTSYVERLNTTRLHMKRLARLTHAFKTFRGKTVWEGIVEVFDLQSHPNASRVYAWSHDTDDPANPKRHVTVLHLGPIQSALDAVRAVIVKEFRDANPAEA